MKFNTIKFWLIIITALATGLAAGYLLFDQREDSGQSSLSDLPERGDLENEIWTCSMHPQIRQSEPGLCPICEMELIPLAAGTSTDPLVFEMTNEAVKLAQVETTVIGHGAAMAKKSITLSGKIQADERLASSQVAHVPGRIEQLFVTFTGEQVSKGQKLAVIYSPQLISAQQELIEAAKFKDKPNAILDAARKKLEYWKIPKEQIDEIERTEKVQELTTVFADASGIVTKRRVAVGDYVGQGDVLFDFVSLDKLWVMFDAYEEDLTSIRIGDRIEFSTPANPSGVFSARVTFIDPLINPETRAASIRAEIENRGKLLKPEMFVRGTVYTGGGPESALLVPRSAVLWTGVRSVVYVKIPGSEIPSFRYQEIQLGARLGEMYVVESGLESGDEVVTNGSFTIDAAAQLNNQASMMNRNVKLKGSGETEHIPDFTETTPDVFKEELSSAVQAYLALKDALVESDAPDAKAKAGALLISAANIDMALLKGQAHMYWMERVSALNAHAELIADSDDIDEQRKQFDFLSQTLIKMVKAFGVLDHTYYVQHCPMAFDNEGAEWLSDQVLVYNPYFGDKMLKCGVIRDTINKDYRNRSAKDKAGGIQEPIHKH